MHNPGIASTLSAAGEYFASGYYEIEDGTPFARWCRAYRRYFEYRELTDIDEDSPLAPSGPAGVYNGAIRPNYSFSWVYDSTAAKQLLEDAGPGDHREDVARVISDFEDLTKRLDCITSSHTVGGRGYTHSIPNYGRIISEGLDGYAWRIRETGQVDNEDRSRSRIDFADGLLDLIAGIRNWHDRIVDHLEASADSQTRGKRNSRKRLLNALHQVPFGPARGFYEALVSYNFIYYLDGCDNPGRFDQELIDPYLQDMDLGLTNREEASALIRAFFENVNANNGWSMGIGGLGREGRCGYNELSRICLEQARSMRRPNLQLNIRDDMPDAVWEAAFDCIAGGSGLPALYNDSLLDASLVYTGNEIAEADRWRRNGGGCTETMMHGCSNVGSLDAGINLPLILGECISETSQDAPPTFEAFLDSYIARIDAVIVELTSQVSRDQKQKSELRPQPVRTLLIDDCIERGIEYNAGGARYNWSVINIAGLADVADSLEALRVEVYESATTTLAALGRAMKADYRNNEALRRRLGSKDSYGNDRASVDGIAIRIASHVFERLIEIEPWRGGRFLGSCIMFVTYGPAGKQIPALPDGRHAGAPIADSIGPVRGRDTNGPTAMLRSAAALPQEKAPGTLVTNIRIDNGILKTPEGRSKLRSLIQTYFDLGGMQLQINTVDQEVIQDAMLHPEAHADLIVRIGGYSEYFNRLSKELKETVLERVVHSV